MKLILHKPFLLRNLAVLIVMTQTYSIAAIAQEHAAEGQMLAAAAPEIFGYLEKVMLEPGRQWKLNAKLDTGADTSSLDARDVRRVKAGGKSYVRFTVTDPITQNTVSLRRPYVRSTRIRRHDGQHQRRRVVLMTVCLGQQERTIEVTLSDRSEFDYPMLLGRNALTGVAIVDPRLKHTHEPGCWVSDARVNRSISNRKNLNAIGKRKINVNKAEQSQNGQDDKRKHRAKQFINGKLGNAVNKKLNKEDTADSNTKQSATPVKTSVQ